MTKPRDAWYGEPVKPAPVSEEFIQELENTGARPEFVAALREDRKKFLRQQKEKEAARVRLEKRKELLRKMKDRYKADEPETLNDPNYAHVQTAKITHVSSGPKMDPVVAVVLFGISAIVGIIAFIILIALGIL